MFWEYSPYSTKLASDWLRAESSLVDEEGKKWMTVSLGTSLASKGIILLFDLWEAHPCLWDPE